MDSPCSDCLDDLEKINFFGDAGVSPGLLPVGITAAVARPQLSSLEHQGHRQSRILSGLEHRRIRQSRILSCMEHRGHRRSRLQIS
jgi:hypothetical protein